MNAPMELPRNIQNLTMSSQEIAELTGKELSNIHRDIRGMLVGLYGEEHVSRIVPEQYRNRHSEFIRENADALLSAIAGDDSKRNHHDQRGFAWKRDNRGYVVSFNLDYNHTMTLISGYNVKLRKAIIDRWQELEEQVAKPAIPQTMAEALRLAADEMEKRALGRSNGVLDSADAADLNLSVLPPDEPSSGQRSLDNVAKSGKVFNLFF